MGDELIPAAKTWGVLEVMRANLQQHWWYIQHLCATHVCGLVLCHACGGYFHRISAAITSAEGEPEDINCLACYVQRFGKGQPA